MFPTSQSRC